jgi:hypothetical protein
MGVTSICTTLTGSFRDGATYTTDARPSFEVSTSLVSSVPADAEKSKRRPDAGEPSAFREVTEMVDIELPSRARTCGAALTISDCANPDGPATDGALCLSTAHADTASIANAAAARQVSA